MVFLTRREHFNGAHRLYNDGWSEEQNRAVFGKCCNKNYHGHNFELYVTVKGAPNPETGFVMNAHLLSKIMNSEVTERLDIPEFANVLPSSENLVLQIWKWLEPHISGCELHCIKLQETENIYVEYFGNK